MTLQEKLQCLLAAADNLRQCAALPETIRSSMYSLPIQINKINDKILEVTEEIAKAPIPTLSTENNDDIPF